MEYQNGSKMSAHSSMHLKKLGPCLTMRTLEDFILDFLNYVRFVVLFFALSRTPVYCAYADRLFGFSRIGRLNSFRMVADRKGRM